MRSVQPAKPHSQRMQKKHAGSSARAKNPQPVPATTSINLAQRRCACGGSCPTCSTRKREEKPQTKLQINEPSDAYEQEADRIAERVVAAAGAAGVPNAPQAPPAAPPATPPNASSGAPPSPPPDDSAAMLRHASHSPPRTIGTSRADTAAQLHSSATPTMPVKLRVDRKLARKCACGGSCSKCKQDPKTLAQREADETRQVATHDEAALLPATLGAGRPLDANTRAFMEAQLGVALDGVRIHQDGHAAAAARSIDAHAYTIGRDIVFGAGRYAPHSKRGLGLLAHELTHVVQQNAAGPAVGVQRKTIQRQDLPGLESSDNSQQCPAAPTGLGKQAPEPACPRATHAGTTEINRWHFCLDSDTVRPGETLAGIGKLIAAHPNGTRYLIHGNASTDGDADYNLALACHRANAVGDAVAEALRAKLSRTTSDMQALLRDRMQVATRGETDEFGPDPASNRVVVMYAEIPGDTLPDEPVCEDAPRHLGDIEPENPCNSPTMDLTGRSSERNLRHFRFCQDSDVITDDGPKAVGIFAGKQASNTTYVVHGFASSEGDSAYNQRLSCHRALRIARELMNAGVRSEQIREVSGVGETEAFSFGVPDTQEVNRVAVVLAEEGIVSHLQDPKRSAQTQQEKQSIVNDARDRLLAGQYESAADFYISRWTCGKTPTVRQAVERLTIEVPDNNKKNRLRRPANGVEESAALGVNRVQISNVALGADNPVECVMGRLVDMAFHHSVVGDPDLPEELTEPEPVPDSVVRNPPASPRHKAGLHLISLAGLFACQGEDARPGKFGADEPTGIDEPETEDPREGMPLPACARGPQPTRLLPPTPGGQPNARTDFIVFDRSTQLRNGRLQGSSNNPEGPDRNSTPMRFITAPDAMRARATVGLLGPSENFADYEIGFMQTVLDDLFIAEYVDGRRVVQKLPVPMRAAHIRGGGPSPSPWLGSRASGRPDAQGSVPLDASWTWETEFALSLNQFRPRERQRVLLDTWQRHTRMGVWLVARRLGAPLDRFSATFIDGSIYDIDESFDVRLQRMLGDLNTPEANTFATPAPERETLDFRSSYRTVQVSDTPADSRLAQFDTPVASDIDMFRQFQRILEPESAANSNGMTTAEYIQTAIRIIDELQVFTTAVAGSTQPRLGFEFARLDVSIRLDPKTGRMLPYFAGTTAENPIQMASVGLGERANHHLARALALRLQKRDFLDQGRPAILRAPPASGLLSFVIEPLREETRLIDDKDIKRDMAEAWSCTIVTRNSEEFLRAKEFGATFVRLRGNRRDRRPDNNGTYFVSVAKDDTVTEMNMACGAADEQSIGTFHTHPDVAGPSDKDLETAETGACGRQHYVVSDDHVVIYFSDGTMQDLGSREALLPAGVKCNQQIPPEIEVV